MKLTIERASYSGGALHLACDPGEGLKFAYAFVRGVFEILPFKEKKKRSRDANAYAWALIHQIAAKLRMPPVDVYRNAILNTGGVTESIVCIAEEAVDQFTRSWVGDHLGRQVQQFPSNRQGFVNLIVIYGSSDYDTAQMSRFIDGLVQDAKELGIETEDPGKVQSLLDSWEQRK